MSTFGNLKKRLTAIIQGRRIGYHQNRKDIITVVTVSQSRNIAVEALGNNRGKEFYKRLVEEVSWLLGSVLSNSVFIVYIVFIVFIVDLL